ncbi:MAG: PadR family transcriptional regulator [Thermoleophilia bacterium]|nr:PadR family transcriptional regulator [Thermoleophilia bacterium]
MAELTRLFGPRYRASPGSVYPAVEALHGEGLIEGHALGGKTVYRITSQGEQALQERSELLAALELRVGVRLGQGDSLEMLLARFKARLAPLTGRVDPSAAAAVLERAAGEIEQLQPIRTSKRISKQRRQHAR